MPTQTGELQGAFVWDQTKQDETKLTRYLLLTVRNIVGSAYIRREHQHQTCISIREIIVGKCSDLHHLSPSPVSAFIMQAFISPVLTTRFLGRCTYANSSNRAVRRVNVSKTRMAVQPPSKDLVQLAKDAQTVFSAQKPPWCQPWSIVGTGSIAIAGSWQIFQGWTAIVALMVSGVVGVWWYVFLVVYPQQELEGGQL